MGSVWGIVWGIKKPGGGIMPSVKRFKTKYPGVYFIEGTSAAGKSERIFYIRYFKGGKYVEEKAGRQFQDNMTPAQAARIRAARIEGKELSNQEKRDAERAERLAEQGKWTIDRLAAEYFNARPDNKGKDTDRRRYEKHLQKQFGTKEPCEIQPLEVDRMRLKLLKTRSPQTVKHVLNLLTWITNFGFKKNLSPRLNFNIVKPEVDNQKTEFLSPDEVKRLLAALKDHGDLQIENLVKMALFTGMRRGELFKLQWDHVDFLNGFIKIVSPKGGKTQKIPMSDEAWAILEGHPRTAGTQLVFPGPRGQQRVTVSQTMRKIKKMAGLPKDFRPLHGLRHHFASTLASSGAVDLYMIQRLLTHKDPRMTQRYSHLHDGALKSAANLAGKILSGTGEKTEPAETQAVVNLEDHHRK